MYMRVGSNKDMDCEEGITEDALLQPLSSTSTRDGDLLAGGSTKEPLWSRVRNTFSFILPNWTASAPWRLKQDGSRAILEGVRAFIGYILMLAVMTLNVGVFIAVLAGIVFGELVLGRYMRHSVWEDGACHD
ncbi:Ctr copper transporter family-domain-containing protein [Aspergillus heterothallicus]